MSIFKFLPIAVVLLFSDSAAAACTGIDFCSQQGAGKSFQATLSLGDSCTSADQTKLYGSSYDAKCTGCVDPTNNSNTSAKCAARAMVWNPVTCQFILDGLNKLSLSNSLCAVAGLTAPLCCSTAAAAVCFPSSATVEKADGTVVSINALVDGDVIVAAAADGAITTDTVSIFSISDGKADSDFLSITAAGKATKNVTITLTPDHHLPVGDSCCSNLKRAKDIKLGDQVWIVEKKVSLAAKVLSITSRASVGLHSPVLIKGSFPIVDGFITSFERSEVVTALSYSLPLLESACKTTGTCKLLKKAHALMRPSLA